LSKTKFRKQFSHRCIFSDFRCKCAKNASYSSRKVFALLRHLTRTKFEFFIKFREIPVINFRDFTHEQGTDGRTDGLTDRQTERYYWLPTRM